MLKFINLNCKNQSKNYNPNLEIKNIHTELMIHSVQIKQKIKLGKLYFFRMNNYMNSSFQQFFEQFITKLKRLLWILK